MRARVSGGILAVVVLLVVVMGLSLIFSGLAHNPRDLSYWCQLGATRDWSSAAAQGDARAEFFQGIALIRTNLITTVGRVPVLSTIPIVGKRLFENTSY